MSDALSAQWPRWHTRLAQLATQHQVPGAVLAVSAGGHLREAAYGVLNVVTGIQTTTDSLFQIGSVTKLYTAALVMQLAETGELRLDDPVVKVLGDFRLADQDAAQSITARHLLTHTSGMAGDHFLDTGQGPDAIARYVASCADLPQSHPVGATCSYCTSGYIVAGHIVEQVTGLPWHQALRTKLLNPLELRHTTALPNETMRFRVAHGHDVPEDGQPRLLPQWALPPSGAPAGTTLCASASDLVRFARAHLEAGVPMLSAASVAAMLTPHVTIPDPWATGSHWGLGWILYDWDGQRLAGHDGGTLGQTAFLRMVPDTGVVIALLTNGGRAKELSQDLLGELLDDLCGITVPKPLAPPAEPVSVDPASYVGTYERPATRIEVTGSSDRLTIRVSFTGPLADLVAEPVREAVLVPAASDLFVTRWEGEPSWTPVVFFSLAGGARYIHMGGRATLRTDDTDPP